MIFQFNSPITVRREIARLTIPALLLLFISACNPILAQHLDEPKTAAPREAAPATLKKSDPPPTTDKTLITLEDRVKQLEARLSESQQRIQQLESKLATQNNGAPTASVMSPSDVVEIKKEITTLQEESRKNSGLLNFFRGVELSGVVDGYYSFNNNRVDMFTQGRAFDVRHNAFSLQLARIALERKNSKDSPLGFRVDLGLGETVDRVISISDSSRNDATKHVLQAYASYVAPVGGGLTLDFGKMYTPIGAEVVDTKDNFNYSRGWLFTYGPYYHAGLRAKYAFNDKVALSGYLFNGWDNLFENNAGRNAGKTIGFTIGLTPTKKFTLNQTYLAGPEAPLANVPDVSRRDNWRHIADTVVTYLASDKLTLMGNFVYGTDGDNDGARGKWTGFAGYFKYAFSNRFAFSPRFEVFNDKDGLRTGVAQTVKDITLTQEMKMSDNLLLRMEYRRDFSNRDFFSNSNGRPVRNQNTVLVGLSYFFSSREQ